MPVRIGVILPTSTPDPEHPVLGDVAAAARFAEECGLESVWSTDHVVASAPILESTAVLATAAAVTSRIRVGYGVMILALRPAAWAAKQISTLQYLSGNRVLLGVGTGNAAHGDTGWRAVGRSFADRGALTDQALAELPALVTGAPTALPDGTPVTMRPGAPMPEMLVAGAGGRAMERAVAHADGWIGIGLTPEQAAAGAADLAVRAERAGRPAPRVTVVGPPLGADPVRAAELLDAYEQAGTHRLILTPDGPDHRPLYERAAALLAR